MPPIQRGQAYRLNGGKWGLRFYDETGRRRKLSPFASKSAALQHFEKVIRPKLLGQEQAPPTMTLSELVEVFLSRHAATRRARTIVILRERLRYATDAFGDVPLPALERMAGDIADWQATLGPRYRYAIVQALRQTLNAAVRWGYMNTNPAKLAGPNPQPPPRRPDPFTLAEVDAIAVELGTRGPLVRFAAATGLRPAEWAALERRDVDRAARIVTVRRTVADGVVYELGKTSRSLRQVPLSARALAALDELPPRLDTPLLFPAPAGGLLNVDNFRRREWAPALEASGVRKRRLYDLRSTFVSHALAAGVSVFEVAKIAGTSVGLIESTYGSLLDGAGAGIAGRLDALETSLKKAAEAASGEVSE